MTKYNYKNSGAIQVRIAEIEKLWKEDLKKHHGGGLVSSLNKELINLRNMLENMKNGS